MQACLKGGEPGRALLLLQEMRRRGVLPDAYCWSSAVSAVDRTTGGCGSGGGNGSNGSGSGGGGVQVGSAGRIVVSLLRQMRADGVAGNSVVYGGALAACNRHGDAAAGLAVLDLMEADGNGFEPDELCLRAAVAAATKGGCPNRAARLLSEIRRRGFTADVAAYNGLIGAIAAAGAPPNGGRANAA
ncbi:unnamed protein product [Phaeothamnion confervicola]